MVPYSLFGVIQVSGSPRYEMDVKYDRGSWIMLDELYGAFFICFIFLFFYLRFKMSPHLP